MRTRQLFLFTVTAFLVLFVMGAFSVDARSIQGHLTQITDIRPPKPPVPEDQADAFRSSPVMFIENAGQWDDRAKFQVWGGTDGTMWLAEDAIWITVMEPEAMNSDIQLL